MLSYLRIFSYFQEFIYYRLARLAGSWQSFRLELDRSTETVNPPPPQL